MPAVAGVVGLCVQVCLARQEREERGAWLGELLEPDGLLAVVGLLLGSQGDFSSWLLAGTVGVFLYVALVSMMTELRGGDWSNTACNTVGMLCGAVLLLFIGLYEHDLILLFEEEREHTH